MRCCGDREKGPISLEEKWDYVNLDDFKSESCLTPFSYFFLWFFLIISLAVYGVDTFTAVNLLAFSRWAGQIEPTIPFHISRWIYAVCIIISFALLIYRWMVAIRAIRSKSIARSYLNSLAVRIQSIRPGRRGRGWKRFLVFAELTKSKKGAEYVALFAYFSFESWMNTVFADGPRQVVNAMTLYSVMQMDLLPGGKNAEKSDDSGAAQFFENVRILAVNNNLRAVVLFSMLFTLVIWVLSVIKLLIAIALYLIFLFHHIPSRDGTLTAYCRRKINTRVMRIVKVKVNKALAKGMALQDRAPTQPNMGASVKPTLPTVGKGEDKGPIVTTISRSTTQTTLPSRPGTAAADRNPALPDLSWSDEHPGLSRTATETSAFSESTAVSTYSPLDRGPSPAPPVPPLPVNIPPMPSNTPTTRPPPSRFTPAPTTARSTPAPGYRGMTEERSYGAYGPPNPVPYRSHTAAPDLYGRSMTPGVVISPSAQTDYPTRTFAPVAPSATAQPGYPMPSFTPFNRSASPAVAPVAYPERTFTPMNQSPQPNGGNYHAFDPSMTSQKPIQPTTSPAYHTYTGQDSGQQPFRPYRNDGNF
ncbi:uncharacterized protein ASPGLDRAFT_122495 [Aspergillus glaucus CBS 516.65]|uniref:Pheromone-regulated membrane protein n=1 Tax=Aspergillus glaucus CBS 516.65 TaxID=1160497 RepID=A0A1L9VPX0_ASPGL|nr:hypothetical protein ASPGLDRAFT_122495 [Aspergillus glaucus CBS 516.65]OJJ85934.1 hypothetical protein ASPGLDRAFT_122495 [Aspergillus glaucus CBS 516.65]